MNDLVKQPTQLRDIVSRMKPQLALAIPTHLSADRMMRIALTAISNNPKLADSTPESFLGALMASTQLGLEPNTPMGQAYLIPYYNNKKRAMECQFQIGYKGMLDLCYRSKEFNVIQTGIIFENDFIEYEKGFETKLVHKPALTNQGDLVAYYALYKTTSGGRNLEIMSPEAVEAHAKKFSKSFSSGPWKNHFDEMAKKTVLKKVLKIAPQSADLRTVQALDMSTLKVNPVELASATEIDLLPEPMPSFNDEGTISDDEKKEEIKNIENLIGK